MVSKLRAFSPYNHINTYKEKSTSNMPTSHMLKIIFKCLLKLFEKQEKNSNKLTFKIIEKYYSIRKPERKSLEDEQDPHFHPFPSPQGTETSMPAREFGLGMVW